MSKRGGLAGSVAVMFAGTLSSRVLGLVRSALLVAAIFSVGGAADAFSVANKLPNIIYMLLAGGVLNAVLVPQIVRAMRREDGGQDYVNRLLTLAGTVMLAATVLLTLAAPVLVTMYAAEFRQGPWAPVAVVFAMWCIPQLFFYGMYTLLGQVLNARSNFGPYMWAPALNNVIAIIGLVAYLIVFGAFDPQNPPGAEAYVSSRVLLLAGTATLGVAAQAAILIVPLYRSGFRYRPLWGVRGSGLGTASKVAGWAFLALCCGQIGYLAVSNLAAAASTAAELAAGEGPVVAGNAAYDIAFLVFMLPQSLITVSLVTAMLTRLSSHAASGDGSKVRDDLSLGLRTLGVFTVFAAGAFAVLAIPLIQVIQFDVATFESYRAIGAVLVAMLIGLPAIAIWTMTQRVYFAYEDTKSLFLIQIPMAAIQILGCLLALWIAEPHWWVVGSGLATAASSMFGAVWSFVALRRKLPSLDGARVLRAYLRLTIALIPTMGVGWGLLHLWGVQTNFAGALLRVVSLGLLMGVIYLILLRRLRVTELDSLLQRIGVLAEPVTRRLAPFARRLPGADQLRTMWDRITGQTHGRGGARMSAGAERALGAGDVIAGRYRLTEPVAVDSAHSSQWLGLDTILDRQVHISTIAGAHREDALDSARRAALISDERLVRVQRVGSHDGVGFIVTDVVPGPTLADLIAAGRLDTDQVRTIVGEAAGALEVARRRGVHHLYLRPTAVHRLASGAVVVSGLAFDAAAAGLSAENARAAARIDTVALVQLLYAGLTGHWPGEPALAGGLPPAGRHHDAPLPPAEVVPEVPHDLDTLCAVTFGPHQDGPYTPGELVRDLAPWPEPGAGPLYAETGAAAGPAPAVFGAAAGDDAVATPTPHRGVPAVAGTSTATPPPAGAFSDAGPAELTGAPATGAPVAGVGMTGPAGMSVPGAGTARAGAVDAATAAVPAPRALDPSGWAPQPPPEPVQRPPFESLISAPEPGPSAQVLDPYIARHERREPGSAPPPGAPGSTGGAVTLGSGATAVPAPGSVSSDLPPTVSPPPGVPAEAVGIGVASAGGAGAGAASGIAAAGVTAGAGAAGAATGTAGAGTAAAGSATKAVGGTAAGIAGALGSGAGAVAGFIVGGTRSAVAGVRSLAGKAGRSTRELTSTFRTESGAQPEADTDRFVHTAGHPGLVEPSGGWDEPANAQTELATGYSGGAGSEDYDPEDVEDVEWEETDPDRFNPTPFVILSMIAVVIVAGILAVSELRDARTSFDPDATTGPTATYEPADPEDEAETEEEPTEEPTEEEATEEPSGPPPVIESVSSLDPSSGSGDNEELAYLAIDGDPNTIWRSLRYNDPEYGMKPGLGFAILLAEPALVTSVTLDVQGNGGLVQIRATEPSEPDSGTVLAEGPMGPEATYELSEPTEAGVLVLWFPELPVADSDGRNRIELAEISLE